MNGFLTERPFPRIGHCSIEDYLTVLATIVPDVLRQAGASRRMLSGSASTLRVHGLAGKNDGTPLCELPEFAGNPHAYVKLWKHHAAQPEANRLNAAAAMRVRDF